MNDFNPKGAYFRLTLKKVHGISLLQFIPNCLKNYTAYNAGAFSDLFFSLIRYDH